MSRRTKVKSNNGVPPNVDPFILCISLEEARALYREFYKDFINQHDNPLAHIAFQRIAKFVRDNEQLA
jgi:hypothetical protein